MNSPPWTPLKCLLQAYDCCIMEIQTHVRKKGGVTYEE